VLRKERSSVVEYYTRRWADEPGFMEKKSARARLKRTDISAAVFGRGGRSVIRAGGRSGCGCGGKIRKADSRNQIP